MGNKEIIKDVVLSSFERTWPILKERKRNTTETTKYKNYVSGQRVFNHLSRELASVTR